MNTRRFRHWSVVAVLAATVLSGCMGTIQNNFTKNSLDRAAFDLQCPKDKVEVVALDKPLDAFATDGTHVGVRGCGRTAVYVKVEGYGSHWVQDKADGAQPSSNRW